MPKATASASISQPTNLADLDTALHPWMDRAMVGVRPGFGEGRRERGPRALQARLETPIVGGHAVLVSLVLPGPGNGLAGLHRCGIRLVGPLRLGVRHHLDGRRGGRAAAALWRAVPSKWRNAGAERRRRGHQHNHTDSESADGSRS